MRRPGQTTWSQGTCTAVVGPRSYEIKIGNTTYRRNRHHLIRINELPSTENTMWEQQTGNQEEEADSTNYNRASIASGTASIQEMPSVHRSQRHYRAPRWMEDYIPS